MADMWTPPEGATTEQFPHGRNPLDGTARMAALLAEFKTLIGDMPGHLLAQAGLRVEPGKLIIEGDLEVPNGVIKNDWLENPVVPARFSTSASGWGTPDNLMNSMATATLTVPTAFTKALVISSGFTSVKMTAAGQALVYSRIVINGSAGDQSSLIINNLQTLSMTAFSTGLATGLVPGATFDVSVQFRTPSAWSADASNLARVSGAVLWFR